MTFKIIVPKPNSKLKFKIHLLVNNYVNYYLIIILLFHLAVVGFGCFTGLSLVVVSGDFFPVVGRGLLIEVASLAAEHGVSVWASVAVAHEL